MAEPVQAATPAPKVEVKPENKAVDKVVEPKTLAKPVKTQEAPKPAAKAVVASLPTFILATQDTGYPTEVVGAVKKTVISDDPDLKTWEAAFPNFTAPEGQMVFEAFDRAKNML